jgi:hypothetical protein
MPMAPSLQWGEAMATNPDDWTKELEADLAALASNMWGTQQRLLEKGFRIAGGNKSLWGWWLTAMDRGAAAVSRCSLTELR